jgi:hypothetical protein
MKPDTEHGSPILKIFNFVGGTLIFFGVAYFIVSNWFHLIDFLKIFTTLGTAAAAFAIAVLIANTGRFAGASAAFFMIAGLLLPLGISVTINLTDLASNAEMVSVVISGTCLFIFLLTHYYLQRDILLLFSIFYGSLFYIALTNLICHQVLQLTFANWVDYQLLVLGIGYVGWGRALQREENGLTGPLYFFGSLLVLATSFDLGGLLFFQETAVHVAWEFISPLLLLSCFLLAVPLKSKAFLYVASTFLLIYLTSITRSFADLFGSLGWPLLLILAGLFLMLFGYVVVNLHRKITR